MFRDTAIYTARVTYQDLAKHFTRYPKSRQRVIEHNTHWLTISHNRYSLCIWSHHLIDSNITARISHAV